MTAPFDYGQMANAMDDGHSPSPPPEGEHDRSDAAPRPHSQSQSQSQSHKQRQSASVTVYQTTGPDAHTGPSLASDGSGTPVLNPRSCTTCRRRKVRCDKTMPCTNCRRALIPCVFPAPGRAPRQPRPRDPNAPPKNTTSREVELTKRLRKLEGIVEELSGQIEVDSVGKDNSLEASPDDGNYNFNNSEVAQPVRSSSLSTEASSREPKTAGSEPGPRDTSSKEARKKFGRLVQNGHKGGTRYVSSAFWSKLNDEVCFCPCYTRCLLNPSSLTLSAKIPKDSQGMRAQTSRTTATRHRRHLSVALDLLMTIMPSSLVIDLQM